MKKIHYSKSRRVRKAYWTTFRVILSYFKLYLLGKIFGKKYYEKRLVAAHLRNANRVKKAILELQGLFVKIGQLLSILSNFLPEAFQEPLEGLQDKIPARPFSEIQQRIQKEFGKQPLELFQTFEETPIAAASIGQAHRATLPDGTAVVVKVQHANIEDIAEVDLEIIRRLTKLVEWFYEIKGIENNYTQVRKMIEEELDYAKEALSMELIRANLAEEEKFNIPEVHPQFSTGRVLTTTFYEGVKISNVQQLEDWGLHRRELGDRLIHAYCQMVFEHGLYHADPHPGNILIQKDGTIVLLDFGAVDTLKPKTRMALLELLEAGIKNDSTKIVAAFKKMGLIADENEAERIAEKVIEALRDFLQNELKFEGLNLKEIKVSPFNNSLFKVIAEVGMKAITSSVQVQKEYVLLNRMVTLLLGICNTLDPHMNPLETVQPYIQKFLMGEKGNYVEVATNFIQQNLTSLLALPTQFQKALKAVNRGELEVRVAGIQKRNQLMASLGKQLIYLILSIALFSFSYLFYQNQEEDFAKYLAGGGGVFLLLLFRKMWWQKI